MKEFWKDNKIITVFLGIVLVYSICFVNDDEETILSMLYAVALSYIAAYLFYVLQVYYPLIKRKKVANKIIKMRVNNILIKINELYKEMFKLYIPNYKENTHENLNMQNLLRFKFDDCTSILSANRIENFSNIEKYVYKTLRELVQELIYVFRENSDFLYKTFLEYMQNDLIDILERMNKSFFMQTMAFSSKTSIRFDFTDCKPNLFKDFWYLACELKKCNDGIN